MGVKTHEGVVFAVVNIYYDMDDYIVCIPSYQRATICKEKTLTALKTNHIPSCKIYVYVANKQEYNEYKNELDSSMYHKIIIGKKGIVEQRQFIMNDWPDKKHIVYMDDDVKTVDLSISARFKNHTLDFFFKTAFQDCLRYKSFIWGIYAVYNPFFRKPAPELTTDLKFIVGAVYGIINRPALKRIRLTLSPLHNGQKEDVERTIKYFVEDGIVLRYNKIGFETKYYGSQGGLGTFEDRIQPGIEISKKLLKAYPAYGRVKMRKNGMPEFVLARMPARTQFSRPTKTIKRFTNLRHKVINNTKKIKTR